MIKKILLLILLISIHINALEKQIILKPRWTISSEEFDIKSLKVEILTEDSLKINNIEYKYHIHENILVAEKNKAHLVIDFKNKDFIYWFFKFDNFSKRYKYLIYEGIVESE